MTWIKKSVFLISEMKRIQLFHEALDRGLQALGYWGRKQHKPIISALSSASRPCQKERRPGYEIGLIFHVKLVGHLVFFMGLLVYQKLRNKLNYIYSTFTISEAKECRFHNKHACNKRKM